MQILLISLVVVALLLCLLFFRTSPSEEASRERTLSEKIPSETNNQTMKLYFCPKDDCITALNTALQSATASIHCAFFELDLGGIIATLNNKSELMDVKVLVDADNLEPNINHTPYFFDNRTAYMHNKFCIIDGSIVTTGSMNPTYNDATKNNNNLLVIPSKLLAQNYEAEFQSFLRGEFGSDSTTSRPEILLNNVSIQNYFCPEDDCAFHIYQELEKANQSIYFMTFSFTHDKIGTLLVAKHYSNVTIKGIMEKSQNSQYSEYALFQKNHMDVQWDSNPKNLHHKVFIIDNSTVITGSFNPSRNADERNDENVIILTAPSLARLYIEEFNSLYNTTRE